MKDHVLTVLSNPTEGREDDYNEWYDQVHLSDVLKVEGVVGVRRYRLAGPQGEKRNNRDTWRIWPATLERRETLWILQK